MRAGGATHLLGLTEDLELVRRRGRWLASRTMEIYLQEAASITYFPALDEDAKDRFTAARAFPLVSARVQSFLRHAIPCEAWWLLLSDDGQMGGLGGFKHAAGLGQPHQQLDQKQTEGEAEKGVQKRLSSCGQL